MLIIDARSGKEVKLNIPIYYNACEYFVMLKVKIGIFSGEALLERSYISYLNPSNLVEDIVTVSLTIRYFHPSYFGKKVAFIPS